MLDNYIMKIQIESRVMGDLALNHIIPTAIAYQNKLIDNANGLKGLGIDNKVVLGTITEISKHIEGVKIGVLDMIDERRRINKIDDSYRQALEYCDNVRDKYFEKIKYHVDKLELFVDNDEWPLVKYREMLFMR
jgi:glutamine synthetase